MRKIQALAAAFIIIVLIFGFASPAHAAVSIGTDQPLYTTRDKQVTLVGSGLSQGPVYYVWLRGPNDNKTSYTTVSFTSISGGMIPPGIALRLNASAALGTYLVSLSSSSTVDDSRATTHFGVWGTVKPLYQRTQSVSIMGGGLFPGTSLKLTIRNPAGNYLLESTLASSAGGDFNQTWRIPPDAVTDVYSVFVDGTGTYDNAQQDYLSQTKFTVTPAVLSAAVTQQPANGYQRTEQATANLSIQYPDGSPVIGSKSDLKPVLLLQDQVTAAFASVSLVDPVNGIWGASVKIPLNATPSAKYRFELPANSFDDGFGNEGGASDTYSNYFQVRNASLVIRSEVNGTQIQIPFGQVSIISNVSYPDGTPLTNGTVTLSVSSGSTVSSLDAAYDPTIQAWRASYSSTFADLWRVGTWTVKINASDGLGNSGAVTLEVAAQPYLFLALIAVAIGLVLFARWTINRYGRRTYFRARKIVQRFRPSTVA